MQEEILDRNREADVEVYAVWLPMIASDARSEWKQSLLPDGRVVHLWHEQRVTGRRFARQTWYDRNVEVAWDIYVLFGPDARWNGSPAPLISWGETVIDARERLRRDFLAMVDG